MGSVGTTLQRIFYAVIVVGIVLFIWVQGLAPWRLFVTSPLAFIGVACVSIIALWVQAKTFLLCLPDEHEAPEFSQLLTIWALGGITSLVAPLVAGIAVRAGMLKNKGMQLKTIMIASMRQMILGIESAALVVGIWLYLSPLPEYSLIGPALLAVWIFVFAARILGSRFMAGTRWSWLRGITAKHKYSVWIYVSMQPLLFALNYWVAYYGVGYPLTSSEAMALAGVTALASLAVVFPNGLGILDAVWVWVAVKNGMDISEGAALILILRLGYLMGAVVAWFGLSRVWLKSRRQEDV